MKHQDAQSQIQSEVLNKISQGSIRMKPRLYFTALWLLAILASIAASVSIAYVINMTAYIIRIQTATTPAYGARQNLQDAVASFPWWSVLLSIGLVLAAALMMRSYSRIYRFRVRTIVILFVAITCVLGLGMSYANFGHSAGTNKHLNTSLQPNGDKTHKNNSLTK